MNKLLIPKEIKRSKRKTISLVINPNGDFIVKAPIKTKDSEIFNFINQKSSWIISKITEQKKNYIKPICFIEGETITIKGNQYTIKFHNKTLVKITEHELFLPTNEPKEKLIAFLKRYAKQYIDERIKLISSLFNFNYTTFSITSAKSCWGSCSYNNKLHFTYKLIFCPQDVIDYVILHELCHTKEKNHSNKFWLLVESFYPDYLVSEKWLKKNRAVMDLI